MTLWWAAALSADRSHPSMSTMWIAVVRAGTASTTRTPAARRKLDIVFGDRWHVDVDQDGDATSSSRSDHNRQEAARPCSAGV